VPLRSVKRAATSSGGTVSKIEESSVQPEQSSSRFATQLKS
jgi:hypothetical protein